VAHEPKEAESELLDLTPAAGTVNRPMQVRRAWGLYRLYCSFISTGTVTETMPAELTAGAKKSTVGMQGHRVHSR
jgi:hypothetical protein